MAVNTVTTTTRAGLSGHDLAALAAAVDAGGTDQWPNDGRTVVYVQNGNGSPLTVTIPYASGVGLDGQVPTARTVVIGAGKNDIIGPFVSSLYSDPTTGRFQLNWSLTANVKALGFNIGA